MPTAITLAGVDFSASAIVKPLPVIAGLDTWAYFGKDLATSQNVGPSGAFTNFSAGAPTYFPNYIHCQNATGAIQTQSPFHAPSESALIVCRQTPVASQVGAQVYVVGNYITVILDILPTLAVRPPFRFSPAERSTSVWSRRRSPTGDFSPSLTGAARTPRFTT